MSFKTFVQSNRLGTRIMVFVSALILLGTLQTASAQKIAGIIVGNDGTILTTLDGIGGDWQLDQVPVAKPFNIKGVSLLGKELPVCAVGDGGNTFFYDGTGFTFPNSGVTDDLKAVFFPQDGDHGWAVGKSGAILFWDGKKWNKQTAKIKAKPDLYTVIAKDNQTAWAAGFDPAGKVPVVLLTTDGGTNWNPAKTPPSKNFPIRSIAFDFESRDAGTIGYLAGDAGLGIWKTKDGGLTWSLLDPQPLNKQANLVHVSLRNRRGDDFGLTIAGDDGGGSAYVQLLEFNRKTREWKWMPVSPPAGYAGFTAFSPIGRTRFWGISAKGAIAFKDNGKPWQPQTNPQKGKQKPLNAIKMFRQGNPQQIGLNESTTPDAGASGGSYLSVIGSQLPGGDISAKNTNIEFAADCQGEAVAMTSAISIVSGEGNSKLISFMLPSELNPGQYYISISDYADSDAKFESSNCSTVIVVQ